MSEIPKGFDAKIVQCLIQAIGIFRSHINSFASASVLKCDGICIQKTLQSGEREIAVIARLVPRPTQMADKAPLAAG